METVPDVCVKVLMLPAGDGTPMYTELALPSPEGRFPTVLRRTPYRRRPDSPDAGKWAADPLIRAGYAVAVQHVRGRNGSGGECIPYKNEREDSLAMIREIRKLPHYNGELFLSGASYPATVWLCAAGGDMSDVRAAALNVQTDRMYYRHYFNGCVRSFCGAEWQFSMMSQQRPKTGGGPVYVRPYSDIIVRALGSDVPYFRDALTHDTDDGYWRSMGSQYAAESMDFPVLFVDGWFDFYTYGMCSMWNRLRPETRKRSCFIMGPYSHATAADPESVYPLPGADTSPLRELLWFEHVRHGDEFPCGEIGKFNYYTVGSGEWHTSGTVPVRGGRRMKLYLSDGSLATEKPGTSELSYVYDPENPPGGFMCDRIYEGPPSGSVPGVLPFVSGPFERDTDFYGCAELSLEVRSDCTDTAFYMKLYMVENGISYGIAECASTLSYALGGREYVPGTAERVDMKTHAISFRIKKGCRVRIDVCSSGSPFVPHSNTAGPWAGVTGCRRANNTVLTGESFLSLRLLDGDAAEERK